ncbi:MAG: PilZ domain-containing protein [Desulfobacterales bacterium]|nr:PilZ domain-containing protein [Desulfobacterales bacterium]MBF0395505.1 PilZ domain-containing protein [Desulfobacterales bacterium]
MAPLMVKMRCKNCGKVLKTNSENAGKKVRCPQCQNVFVIPDAKELASRKADRVVIQESKDAISLSQDMPAHLEETPFCQVVYTEADPIQFTLKRKNQVPLLDLSEGGLAFYIKTSEEVAALTFEKIIPIEIDFPTVLFEPLSVKVEVRWIKPMAEQKLLHVGVKFNNPDKKFLKIVSKLIELIISKPDTSSDAENKT